MSDHGLYYASITIPIKFPLGEPLDIVVNGMETAIKNKFKCERPFIMGVIIVEAIDNGTK